MQRGVGARKAQPSQIPALHKPCLIQTIAGEASAVDASEHMADAQGARVGKPGPPPETRGSVLHTQTASDPTGSGALSRTHSSLGHASPDRISLRSKRLQPSTAQANDRLGAVNLGGRMPCSGREEPLDLPPASRQSVLQPTPFLFVRLVQSGAVDHTSWACFAKQIHRHDATSVSMPSSPARSRPSFLAMPASDSPMNASCCACSRS